MAEAAQAFDLVVVGGGINGAGIARDAAGRGLRVLLVEQDDLAQHTSSASSKLIHGGLRYLEQFAFRLVREALKERELLLGIAPHIIRPLRFVLPHHPSMRPAWLIRIGLFLYDHLCGRERLPGCARVRLGRADPYGSPLKPEFRVGFLYSDCLVDDSRLVVLNALDAARRGAEVCTRTRLLKGAREAQGWRLLLEERDGGRREVRARALVNAAGPWVSEVLQHRLAVESRSRVRLVKGSHILLPRLYEGDHAYILQNDDGRVVFVIPFEEDFSLVGTTDVPFAGDPGRVAISEEEVEYLLRAVGRYWAEPPRRKQVVWSYAGVRPLYDDQSADPSAVTRDYVFDLDPHPRAPLLSIFGGKITTYRRLAEAALARLAPLLGNRAPGWTAGAPLPGGDLPGGDFAAFFAGLTRRYGWLGDRVLGRLARAYGTRIHELLAGAEATADLGRHFGSGLYEREVRWLVAEEWARSAEDILFRRTKLGLFLAPGERAELERALSRLRSAPGDQPLSAT